MVKLHSIADSLLNSRFGQYMTNPNASDTAVKIATVSNITKDGVNCAYYVMQSLNNQKIPEENRAFVAGMDFANGGLNVIGQAVIGTWIGKWAGEFFDKRLAPKYFSEDVYKATYKQIQSKLRYEEFVNMMDKYKNFSKTGLKVITALIGMQIVSKRIITPLLATPMASIIKEPLQKWSKNRVEKTND